MVLVERYNEGQCSSIRLLKFCRLAKQQLQVTMAQPPYDGRVPRVYSATFFYSGLAAKVPSPQDKKQDVNR